MQEKLSVIHRELCFLRYVVSAVPYIVKAKCACLHFIPAVKNSDRSFASSLQNEPVTLGFVLGCIEREFMQGTAFIHTERMRDG